MNEQEKALDMLEHLPWTLIARMKKYVEDGAEDLIRLINVIMEED